MKPKHRLTVRLDPESIHKVKILAAQRSTSVSGLVAQTIERMVDEENQYLVAKQEALATLAEGYHLGGGPMPSRDDLHERRGDDLS